jgi:hypothetical protein
MISFGEGKERVHERGREYASIYSALPLGAVAREMEYSRKEVRHDRTFNSCRDGGLLFFGW